MGLLYRKKSDGFTIIELLVVVVIIGILAAIVVVAYSGITKKAHDISLVSDLKNNSSIIKIFYAEKGYYPVSNNCDNTQENEICLINSGDNIVSYKPNSLTELNSYRLSVSLGDSQYSTNQDDINCPNNFILVPGSETYGTSDFCVMKYEAKMFDANTPISQASGRPWVDVYQSDAILLSKNVKNCVNCNLITEAQWMTLAQNIANVGSNWSGGSVGSGYLFSGHCDNYPWESLDASNDGDNYFKTNNFANDNSVTNTMVGNSQRRTMNLSNGEVIWDIAGNVHEWTSDQISGGQPGILGSGYAWRNFNSLTTTGSLIVNVFPSGTNISGSSSWTSVQGIGKIQSSTEDLNPRGTRRGGSWNRTIDAGIFGLDFQNSTTTTKSTSTGFRVTSTR